MIDFDLTTPMPYLNVEATKGAWQLDYPNNTLKYVLRTETKQELLSGYWQVPDEVIAQWTTNDDVITDALLEAEPWDITIIPIPIVPHLDINTDSNNS